MSVKSNYFKMNKEELEKYSLNLKVTKSDNKIYYLLYEASIF